MKLHKISRFSVSLRRCLSQELDDLACTDAAVRLAQARHRKVHRARLSAVELMRQGFNVSGFNVSFDSLPLAMAACHARAVLPFENNLLSACADSRF